MTGAIHGFRYSDQLPVPAYEGLCVHEGGNRPAATLESLGDQAIEIDQIADQQDRAEYRRQQGNLQEPLGDTHRQDWTVLREAVAPAGKSAPAGLSG